MLGALGLIFGSDWGLLKPSWGFLGSLLGDSGTAGTHLGAILGPPWGTLGATMGPETS